MFLDPYHTVSDGWIRIRAVQASRFARDVAGDYNPIHNPDARRFCVPGDLLFALVLGYGGLYERMRFEFRGMVGDDLPLRVPGAGAGRVQVTDAEGRVVLDVEREGECTWDPAVVEAVALRYVAFSGNNFRYLKPLMAEQGVMFNTDRPMVVYRDMGLDLDRLDIPDPRLALSDSALEVHGRRADALLRFGIRTPGGALAGTGWKTMLLSGLREYDESKVRGLMAEFERLRRVDAAEPD
ncbi:MAG TPA: DUF3581 family protein [Gammaproteobacteria bacterium]|nr:DUF3581 family protein [Gammaproteobacteria bacterium]